MGIFSHKVDVLGSFFDVYIDYADYIAKECPYVSGASEHWESKKTKMDKLLEEYADVNILFAYYDIECYQGEAFVLFERAGELYEVNGSHCSCYGLEGQWEEEPTSIETIAYRLIEGELGYDNYSHDGNVFKNELCEFLGVNNGKE